VTRLAFVLWPNTFEDWYDPLGVDRAGYLAGYDGEWSTALAGALVRGGVDVHLVHATLDTALSARHEPSGATAHFVPTTAGYRAVRQLLWGHRWWERTQWLAPVAPVAAAASLRLVRRLARLRPDLVVVQDYETARYDVLALLLRAARIPFVAMDTGGSSRPSRAPWKRATRGLARRLLAVHSAEADRLRRLGHAAVEVWPAPVRTDLLTPGDRDAARRALGVEGNERLVFTACRLHPVKNLPLLAGACADAGATLVIAGEGTERPHLQGERMAHVRLLGWQRPEQLAAWYAAADVVGLSSNHEGQPIAVLEAFACGRAVVATNVGGIHEMVRDGETGWLVPPRDRDELAAALGKALADRATTDRYGEAGHELVVRDHSVDAVARWFAALPL
jgi:glycosyltransferase involved in cell wall biosynthesis